MKNSRLGLLFGLLLLNVGCTYEEFNPAEWAVEPILELSESGLVFDEDIDRDTIKISTNYQTFDVSCQDVWCKITPNHSASELEVCVEPNTEPTQRRTTIFVNVGRGSQSLTKALTVVQKGGCWDVVGPFSVFWTSDVAEDQKKIISEIILDMVEVKGGTFVMGTEDYGELTPPHNVTLSDFYINRFEVTQKQWHAIMGNNPSLFKGKELPVENIKWEDALEFVTKLSQLTKLNFSMPTEAQWEYAARGGKLSMGYRYPGSNKPEDVAIYKGYPINLSDISYTTYLGGQLKSNELGLHDMAGNVSEICSDWYGDYDLSDQENPVGPAVGESHVKRGGDISVYWILCNSFIRLPSNGGELVGLRLCVK